MKNKSHGFTLVESLIVICLLILMGLWIKGCFFGGSESRDNARKIEPSDDSSAVEKQNNGKVKVGSNEIKLLNEIPVKEDGICLRGPRFEVKCGKGVIHVKIIDKKSTIEDLVLFLHSEGWNGRLKHKFASNDVLNDDELLLGKLILQEDLVMIEALSLAMMVDCRILECKQFDDLNAKRLGWKIPLSDTDIARAFQEMRSANIRLNNSFLNGGGGTRGCIRDLANCFKEMPRAIPECENVPLGIMSAIVSPEKQGYEAGGKSSGTIDRVVQYANIDNLIKAIVCPPKPTPIEMAALKVTVAPKEISRKWIDVENSVIRYSHLTWQVYTAFVNYVRGDRLRDVEFIKEMEDFNRHAESGIASSYSELARCVNDYPFVVLTFRAFGQYRQCKGRFNDDEARMEAVMRKYGEAVSGTKMLTRLETDFAIDLYERLLHDFKADLDNPLSDKNFKRVLASAKLKEMSERVLKKDRETGLNINEFNANN